MIDHDIDYNWLIKINISTYQPNGLLLWQGSISNNYLSVGILDGNVAFVANGQRLLNSATLVNGQNHQILLKKLGTKIILGVDNTVVENDYFDILEDEKFMENLKADDIFIGGLPKNDPNFNNG